MTSTPTIDDHDLEQHLRYVLGEVARSATADATTDEATDATPRRSRRRPVVVGVAAAGLALGSIAAWHDRQEGEIHRIPVEAALQSGTASDGTEWWMFPTNAVLDSCDGAPRGVVLVGSDQNRPGFEWDMMGVEYGEPAASDLACAPHDTDAWLADPSRADIGRTSIGGSDGDWGYLATVHPDVAALEVAVAGGTPFTVPTVALPDGAEPGRYASFTVDADVDPAEVLIVLVEADGDRLLPNG